MGEPWMMFTKEQLEELITCTNSEWITINGVNGRKFTPKRYTTKSIFLPAAGMWYNTNYNDENSQGYYWSSTSWHDNPVQPYYITFFQSGFNISRFSGTFQGWPIRPVRPLEW